MTAPDWRTYASCLGLDTDDFYPEKGGAGVDRAVINVCAGCEVRQQCLDFALEHHIREGVWGGLTPVARRRIVKARRAVA